MKAHVTHRYWVVDTGRGRFGWECPNRDQAERAAWRMFGRKLQVLEVSVVEWRRGQFEPLGRAGYISTTSA